MKESWKEPYETTLAHEKNSEELPPEASKLWEHLECFYYEELDSTMERAFQLLREKRESNTKPQKVFLVLSQTQSQGRGRNGRTWISPPGQGLYVTYALETDIPLSQVSGISLALGVAVCRTVKTFGGNVFLKWPNDIVLPEERGYKKLGGILLETESSGERVSSLLLGIGLNNRPLFLENVPPAISFQELLGHSLEFPLLLATLTRHVFEVLSQYPKKYFSGFREEWEQYSMMKGREVRFQSGDIVRRGTALGVDSFGALMVKELETGKEHRICSGEVLLIE